MNKIVAGFILLFFALSSNAEELALDALPEVSEKARNNMNYLMQQSLLKAKGLLEETGDLYPFGAALFGGGKVRYIWVGDTKNSSPPVALGLQSVRRALQANAVNNKIVASAVYYVLATKNEDGLIERKLVVELEHLPNIALVRAVHYEVKDNVVEYGSAAEVAVDPKVFVVDRILMKKESES